MWVGWATPRGKLINILLYFMVNFKTHTIEIRSFVYRSVCIRGLIVKLNWSKDNEILVDYLSYKTRRLKQEKLRCFLSIFV